MLKKIIILTLFVLFMSGCQSRGNKKDDNFEKQPEDNNQLVKDENTSNETVEINENLMIEMFGFDSDGDSLADEEEIKIGTDPNVYDTDQDNLNDGVELRYKTDPLNPDSDGDGYLDGDEVISGFDPTKPREKAGVPVDSVEQKNKIPLPVLSQESDIDYDGLSDYDEVNVYHTDPNMADSDLDGHSDGEEIQGGYNPLLPD